MHIKKNDEKLNAELFYAELAKNVCKHSIITGVYV